MGHGQVNEALTVFGDGFVILAHPSEPIEPAKGSFHYPALRQENKTRYVICSFNNLKLNTGQIFHPSNELSPVATVCPDLLKFWAVELDIL